MLKSLSPVAAFSDAMIGALPLPAELRKRAPALIAMAVSEGDCP